jgi:hypothetical protein
MKNNLKKKAATSRIYLFAITSILLLCTNKTAFAQQADRKIILQNIGMLRMPNGPDCVTITALTSTDAQIIAFAKAPGGHADFGSIVSSRLGKGKIILVGSDLYLQKPLLNNDNIQTLINNILQWGIQRSKKTIQLWTKNDDLEDILKSSHYQTITNGLNIDKQSGVIILSQDITDTVKIKTIEGFVRNGGTLFFASPLSGVLQQISQGYYNLKMNDLLSKAGIYNTYMPVSFAENKGVLNIGKIPAYLNIHTALSSLKSNNLSPQKDEVDAYAEIIHNYLSNHSDTTNISREINTLFGVGLNNSQAVIPSKKHPVTKSDVRNYLAYRVQQSLVKQYTICHPLAKTVNPTSKDFPGLVNSTSPRVNERLTIPASVGTQGLLEPNQPYYRWHSTGLYVAAGDVVSISLNPKDTRQHLKAQIGVHDDDLNHMPELTRNGHDLTETFELDKPTTAVSSPFGGLLIIKIPDTSSLKSINIQVNGAVKSPYFKLGVTSVKDWQNTIRDYPAP